MLKTLRKLKKEVAQLRAEMDAIKRGRVILALAQTNVTQPGNEAGTIITEGPTTGAVHFDGKQFVITLTNQSGK